MTEVNSINKNTIPHVEGVPLSQQKPPTGLGTYIWGWSQYVVTLAIFYTCWYNLTQDWPGLLWSIPLGWGVFATWMIGHDCYHDAAFPAGWTKVNTVASWLTMDLIVMSRQQWILAHHKEHHSYPGSSVDTQRLEGQGQLEEFIGLLKLVGKYIWTDIRDILRLNSPEVQEQIDKDRYWYDYVFFVIRMCFFASLGWKGFICTVISLDFCIGIFGLLTHSNQLKIPAKGFRQKQLQNTADFFPGNWFAELLYAGLNAHATHHVWPHLHRGALLWGSNKLKELEPRHYRCYDTIAGVYEFWRTRKNPPPPPQCPHPKDYYKQQYEIQ
jgi:fatty acid desaturase